MPTKLGIYIISSKNLINLLRICMHIHIPNMKSLEPNHATRSTLHIFGISLNKYDCYFPNIAHMANNQCFCMYMLKHNQLQLLLYMLLPNLCYVQICPPNWAHMPPPNCIGWIGKFSTQTKMPRSKQNMNNRALLQHGCDPQYFVNTVYNSCEVFQVGGIDYIFWHYVSCYNILHKRLTRDKQNQNSLDNCKIVASSIIVPIQYAKFVSLLKYVGSVTHFNALCDGTNFSINEKDWENVNNLGLL